MDALPRPGFWEAFRFWLKLGWISFGGPAGQIALMHEELVEKRRWIREEHFLHALTYCNLLPGPEAQQLATYCGWLLHRTPGGIAAGALFVLPSVLVLWLLSYVYAIYGALPAVAGVFYGLTAAVLAVVLGAVLRIGKKTLKNPALWLLAAAAFGCLYFLRLGFPWVILGAGLIGWFASRYAPHWFRSGGHGAGGEGAAAHEPHTRPSWTRAAKVLALCLALWWAPVLGLACWLGRDSTPVAQGVFFSKAAMVTFGGAYAVLPYIAQQAVEQYHWVTAEQMTAGLGLAETTPGPLIMVVQFVGFLGGYQLPPAGLSPLAAATVCALITTWVTFLPCFLWIFLGAPYVERLRGHARLSAALTAITAAVVGVVLNLAIWFGGHLIFPAGGGVDWFVVAVALAAFVAMQRFRAGIIPVLLAAAALGLAWTSLHSR